MNAIIGMSNQLAHTNLTQRQQFFLETINTAAENLLVIINDILDLSKIEAGKLSLEQIGFEPGRVIRNAIEVFRHKAEEKGLRLTCAFPDDHLAPVLIGDPFRINQVLLNLLSNAIKFTQFGSVSITCSVTEDQPSFQRILCCVEDTGIGMDEEYLGQLFDKFSQENESISRRYGGTGLGLSISKQLIELMNGTIEVSSNKGRGTSFRVTLELQKGSSADLPVRASEPITGEFLQGKRILVADDNEMNRLVAATILERYGAEVIETADGQDTVVKTGKCFPDLILMDIQMPEMNGYEATRQLRKNGQTVPIIALTANAIKGENEKCLEAGMNDYISKPFREDDFLRVVARWLKKNYPEASGNPLPPEPAYSLASLRAMSRGNDAFVQKMVTLFCEQTPVLVADMRKAWEQKELITLGNLAHKIKPSINMLNIHPLKEIILQLEATGKKQTPEPETENWLLVTEEVTATVVKAMQQELAGFSLP